MMNRESKVSVVIPAYNSEETIGRSIRSVLSQSFSNFELIIVNDASSDGTEKVVKSFNDPRIIFVDQEENSGGPAKPINTGIKKSKGDYIAILENDDEWLSGKLEKQLILLDKLSSDTGLVGCNVLYVKNGKEVEKKYSRNFVENIFTESLKGCPIYSLSSILVKKEVFEEVGLFDERIKVGADLDMYIRMFKFFKFNFVDEVLIKKYIHGENLSRAESSYYKKALDKEIILEKHVSDFRNKTKLHSSFMRRIGSAYCLGGDFKKGREFYIQAIYINLFNLKAYVFFLTSFLGVRIFRKFNFLYKKVM